MNDEGSAIRGVIFGLAGMFMAVAVGFVLYLGVEFASAILSGAFR